MRNKSVFLKVFVAAMITTGVVFGQTEYITVNGIELVFVKAGSFTTSGGTTVTLTEDFYIGKYPVTQAEYRAVMDSNPSYFSGDNKPVEQVTWQNAVDFCKKVGGFLPTEAQWEFAARGGNNSKGYIYSGSNNLDEVGWYYNNSNLQTHDVGQKNPNELGIYDMSGNIAEWVADWYQNSYPSSSTNPTGAISGSYRVLRGGCWNNDEDGCRVSYRFGISPGGSFSLGFRVAFPRNSTINFNTNGGSVTPDLSVPPGAKIDKPTDPQKEHHAFRGWFTDAAFNNEWNFEINTVTQDMTLYAKWYDTRDGDAVELTKNKFYIYNAKQQKLETIDFYNSESDKWATLREDVDFSTANYANNTNPGMATVTVTGIGAYTRIGVITMSFKIDKRIIEVNWNTTELEWNGDAQKPTPIIGDEHKDFPVIAVTDYAYKNLGYYDVEAKLQTPNANVTLSGIVNTKYEIKKKEITVQWENTGPFVYNKMIQMPTPKVRTGDIKFDTLSFSFNHIDYREVGSYTVAKSIAPKAEIRDDFFKPNIILQGNSIDFEIIRKPLKVVIKDDKGKISEEVEVKKGSIKTVDDMLDSLKKIIGYDGFARDTIKNEVDDESVLNGKPKFEVSQGGNSQRSLRGEGLSITELIENGEYLVKVSVSDIIAQNYMLKEEQITVKVSDSLVSFSIDNRGTPVIKPQKSDKKHGIMLEKNIVSDKAVMHVILPNDKISQVKVVIYDNTGNVVFERSEKSDKFSWNLTNSAGRIVANGTYLIVAEVKGGSGKTYVYSAKLGVKR